MSAAALVSTDTIFAWACGERITCSHSAPSSGLSSMNCPFPVSSLWSSRRLTGWPAPKRILPGRMFISMSLESFLLDGVVLVLFLIETTRPCHSGDAQLHIEDALLARSFRDAPSGAGPESILTIAVM